MRRKGPLITLLVGLGVALVLILLDVSANSHQGSKDAANNKTAAGKTATPTNATKTTAPPTAPPTTAPPLAPTAYVGATVGGGAGIAIAVNNGKAVAYLCDGKKIESWLQGTAVNGSLSLTGTHGGTLTGTFDATKSAGTVVVDGKQWTFSVPSVHPPSGLYRSTARVRNAALTAGWVVTPGGQQFGIFDLGSDGPVGAPTLTTSDNGTGTATIDGETVTAVAVDGSQPLS
jgi:hypothetical protein